MAEFSSMGAFNKIVYRFRPNGNDHRRHHGMLSVDALSKGKDHLPQKFTG